MNKLEKLLYDIVLPYRAILEETTFHGIRIDTKKLYEMKEKYEQLESDTEAKFRAITGDVSPRSSQQIAKLLQREIKDKYLYIHNRKTGEKEFFHRTEKGALSTDEYTIKALRYMMPDPPEFLDFLLTYRRVKKLLSTYIGNESKGIIQYIDDNDYIHPTFMQIAATGRLVSWHPNFANQPARGLGSKDIQSLFITDNDSLVIVAPDWSQFVLRYMAHFSKDKPLLNAFQNNGDPHTDNAKSIFEKDEISKQERYVGKTIGFMVINLATGYGIHEELL